MPGGDSGPDGEEPALSSVTGESGSEGKVVSGQHDGGAQSDHLRGEGSSISGGEVGREDEGMTSSSHDLSSSANHSPGSTSGSTSTSTKRYLPDHCDLTFWHIFSAPSCCHISLFILKPGLYYRLS